MENNLGVICTKLSSGSIQLASYYAPQLALHLICCSTVLDNQVIFIYSDRLELQHLTRKYDKVAVLCCVYWFNKLLFKMSSYFISDIMTGNIILLLQASILPILCSQLSQAGALQHAKLAKMDQLDQANWTWLNLWYWTRFNLQDWTRSTMWVCSKFNPTIDLCPY